MKKQLLFLLFFGNVLLLKAQSPYFSTNEVIYKTNSVNAEVVNEYKDLRDLVKFPNVFASFEQIDASLQPTTGNVFYQAVRNPFLKNFVVLERNRFSREFSLYTYSTLSKEKQEIFSSSNCPVANRALKPLGFISANELIVEAVFLDSHIDHDGVYVLNTETKTIQPLGMEQKIMTSPILSEDRSLLYYISTTDSDYDVIHGNYNVLKTFSLANHEVKTVFTSTNAPIAFLGFDADSPQMKNQLTSYKQVASTKSLVDYRLPFDSLTGYYVSRHGTPAPSGTHVSSGYDAVYLQFNSHGYPAVDFDTPDNQHDNITASAPGVVTFAGVSCGLTCGYGNLVIIEHNDGRRTYNGHMSSIYVSVGDCVGYGTTIGKEGTTGGSSGDHQHFEWRAAGGNASELVAFNDVGMPRQAYYYISNTPTLACSVNSPIVAPSDNVDPITSVVTPAGFQTQNFTATFTDNDDSGGSGIEKAFYQPIDYNGTEWRANPNRGFFSDNFDGAAINAEWQNVSGTWAVGTGYLTQTDEVSSNTNTSAFIKSNLSNRYLYHVEMKIEGAGTNRRAGFHYFASNATTTNRTSGYFVWFRVDEDLIEIYKVTNDVFTLMTSATYTINPNQWYDVKLAYDRITGKHQIFVNNNQALSYVDATPYATGDYFSFRSGNAKLTVNQLKVFRTRLAASTILVGTTGDFRYSNPSPALAAGKVKSVITDNAGNISTVITSDVNVDFTPPIAVLSVNDGVGADISTTATTNTASANWTTSTDPNSGILKYEYALGTSAGATNVTPWTDNGMNTSVLVSGLNLIPATTYYFSVRSTNNATLVSTVTSSNGFIIDAPVGAPTAGFSVANTSICSSDSIQFTNASQNATTFAWSFPGGSPSTSNEANPSVFYPSSGSYSATLTASNGASNDIFTTSTNVTILPSPSAAFTSQATTVNVSTGGTIFLSNTSSNATSYSWSFGDGGTSTDQNPYWSYTDAGVYSVVLTATNTTCGANTDSILVTVINDLGIEENQLVYSVILNGSELIIVSKVNGNKAIKLVDLTGRIIASGNVSFHQNENVIFKLPKEVSVGKYHLVIDSQSIPVSIQF